MSEESDLICLRDEGHQLGLKGGKESEGYPLKLEFSHYGQSAVRLPDGSPGGSRGAAQLRLKANGTPALALLSSHQSLLFAGHQMLFRNVVVLHGSLEFTAHQITLLCATTGEFGRQN